MLRLYNTQTRHKETFTPLNNGQVKMYVCGPTVYNYFHLGNARPFITYDTLRRFLEFSGYHVSYVQNFTDIDDKMINRANSEEITVQELADRFIREYFYDADRLNIKRATIHPRATETIDTIVDLVQTLMDKGYAYEADDGVYFDVSRFKPYGQLSHHRLEELESSDREMSFDASDKRSRMDFVLWKKKKEHEPFWPSPWGDGRPGWHIECSAMIIKHLGETIDIHGGGQDLVFPHHENEIAQSEAATGKPFVRYWLHNGFINIDQEKMSKSAGNFFTVRDLAEHHDYLVLRFFMLSSHYRMPINFSAELLQAAENGWKRIQTCLDHTAFVAAHAPLKPEGEGIEAAASLRNSIQTYRQAFVDAMNDDLNTADAIAAVFELVRTVNTAATVGGIDQETLKAATETLHQLLDVLGLTETKNEDDDGIPFDILELVSRRTEAKKQRDFARADTIRDEIQKRGFSVVDTPQGPKVSVQ
ncbi:MAG: cysteine--tRNA ligase [Clostridiaceae bacterium]|nr:cysteine--tRNA ligase [Clostridiaceae bacterium]